MRLFLICLGFLVLAGCATTPRMESVTSFRSYDVPLSMSPERLVEPVKTAMAVRASNLMVTRGIVSDTLPERPGNFEMGLQQIAMPFGAGMSFQTVKCPNAYTIISNSGGFSRSGTTQSDNYTACLYPYREGTRVHIVVVSTTTHRDGLTGMVNSAVKKGLVGSNEDAAERSLDKIAEKLSTLVPGAELIKSSKVSEPGGILPR